MDRDVRMVTLVRKEQRESSRSVRSIVISKLGKQKQVGPVVLLVIAIEADVLL